MISARRLWPALFIVTACKTIGSPLITPTFPVVGEGQDRADRGQDQEMSLSRALEVRGLWVVRFSMTNESRVRQMVLQASEAGFNTLILQVRGRADAYYQSELEPKGQAIDGPDDFDPLALAIEEGHRRGMAVHAWVNTHLVWGPAAPPTSVDHLVNANPEWLAVPRGLSEELFSLDPRDPEFVPALIQYAANRPATVEGIYTSPSHPEVRERILAVWLDLLNRYDLDGIHFDYIRFPSEEFDYSRGALERFQDWVRSRLGAARLAELERTVGRDPFAFVNNLPSEWAEFRRIQITSLVRDIYGEIKARKPQVTVSAAVVADSQVAYGTRFQDWHSWLSDGIIDIAVPMAYTRDRERFQSFVRTARAAAGSRERVWAGVGSYMNTPEGTLEQIELARSEDVGGVVLFSYDWATGEGRGDPDNPFLQRIGREGFQSR